MIFELDLLRTVAQVQEQRSVTIRHLVHDLDKEQIADFRLHRWADQYLMLRADLYNDSDDANDSEDGGKGNENRSTTVSSDEAIHDPNGLWNHTRTIPQHRYLVFA